MVLFRASHPPVHLRRLIGPGLLAFSLGCALITRPGPVVRADLRVGEVAFLSDTTSILATLGQPLRRLSVVDHPSLGFLEEWIYREITLSFYGAESWRCSSLELVGPAVTTTRGLRVGDTLARVRTLYGSARHQRQVGDTLWLGFRLRDESAAFGVYIKATRDTVRSIRLGRLSFTFM